jgi:transcriptional regulator with XRE-family HTH domain
VTPDESQIEYPTYSKRLGERLRAIRRQQGLSLHDVESRSGQEFKASVLGAYERSERAISVPRLHRLATLYQVPIHQLLPRLPGDVVLDLDAEAASDLRAGADLGNGAGADDGVTIDLVRLQTLDDQESDLVARYVRMIQLQRQDFNGRMLSIRESDLRALSYLLELSPDAMRRRLSETGVALSV